MLADEKKLRWCGVDMRPRWRRRGAVLLTFLLLLVGMDIASTKLASHPYWCFTCWVAMVLVIEVLSVMRQNGPVKRFEEANFYKMGSRDMEIVEGLDGWAQYFFGAASFEAATPEQQDHILNRFRAGKRLFPRRPGDAGTTPWLDERELKERSAAERWAMRTLFGWMVYMAFHFVHRAARGENVEPLEPAFWIFLYAQCIQWLPRARVLWTEPDPRTEAGELELVSRAGTESA